jgi:hypothetical protein
VVVADVTLNSSSVLFKGFASVLPPDGDLESAYKVAAAHADFVGTWVGAEDSGYWNLAEYLGGWWGDTFVRDFTRGNGMFPILNLSFIDRDDAGGLVLHTPPGVGYDVLSSPAFRTAYRDAAVETVKVSRPAFVSLGNEVNRWYEDYGVGVDDPNGFQHFVSLYEETYDAVKAASPETTVFCIFAREVVDRNRQADMEVLKLFDPARLDMVAFTSYPFSVQGVRAPGDIDDDYYAGPLAGAGLSGKPLAFTELGWSTLDAFGGESAQATFLQHAAGRLTRDRGLDLRLLAWWSLYDLSGDPHLTGLLAADGREKPAFAIWKSL